MYMNRSQCKHTNLVLPNDWNWLMINRKFIKSILKRPIITKLYWIGRKKLLYSIFYHFFKHVKKPTCSVVNAILEKKVWRHELTVKNVNVLHYFSFYKNKNINWETHPKRYNQHNIKLCWGLILHGDNVLETELRWLLSLTRTHILRWYHLSFLFFDTQIPNISLKNRAPGVYEVSSRQTYNIGMIMQCSQPTFKRIRKIL